MSSTEGEFMRAIKLLVLAAVLALAVAAPASAGSSTGGLKVTTIAGGLDNPRHLAFGPGGLYVAEAGRGGDGPCFPGPEGETVCVGDTGAIALVDRRGQTHTVVDGLASFANEGTGAAAIGPHGIDVGFGRVFFTNGGPTAANRDDLTAANPAADNFGRLFKLKRGNAERVADIWGFERDNNPDADVANPEIDSNAVDVLVDRGRLVVPDAGGNSLLKVRRNGSISVIALFPNRTVQFNGADVPMQAVPTSVATAGHGDYFVSQLTGFPFPVGGANVYRVDRRTGDTEVFADGFTNIMDLAVDRRGKLWVLEIDHDGLLGGSTDGAIYSVDRNGDKTQLELPAGTLTHPGGITVGRDGALYVTNHGDEAGTGEVVRIQVGHKGHHGHGHGGHGHGHHGHGHGHHGHGHHHGHGGQHR
jgi:hypothetical protein